MMSAEFPADSVAGSLPDGIRTGRSAQTGKDGRHSIWKNQKRGYLISRKFRV